MNGTTRCPHCETRFKITEAQFTAHQGMVRCGHCMQAFDSRSTFIPEQPDPHFELLSTEDEAGHEDAVQQVRESHGDESDEMADTVVAAEHRFEDQSEVASIESTATQADDPSAPEPSSGQSEDVTADHETEYNPGFAPTHPNELESASLREFHSVDLAEHLPVESVDAIDLGDQIADHHSPQQLDDVIPAEETPFGALLAMDKQTAGEYAGGASKRRIWSWAVGISVSVLLLLAQSVYFFRVGLAVHVPAIKPALAGYCHLLNCTVPLPQNAELISIESSGLEADPVHENQIAFTALLRNRAGYAQTFPELALTLNDNQDKPEARRFFEPRDYLPVDENVQTGFLANHELSVKLRLNTGDLRPVGYRLELFYTK